MKKNSTTLKIKKKTHDALMAIKPQTSGHQWVMLGANRSGTVVDYAFPKAYDVCNTPGIDGKAMAKAAVELIKRKRSPTGFYIIPAKGQHRRSGRELIAQLDRDENTSAEQWYVNNLYALGDLKFRDTIYVKRSMKSPAEPTAILTHLGRIAHRPIVEIIARKPKAKIVAVPATA
jgi:hypothetical protein